MSPQLNNGLNAAYSYNTATPQFDLTIAWRLFREHFLGILFVAVMVAALAALVVYRMPSEYTATTTVLVEPDKEDQIGLDAVFSNGLLNREYFETQRSLIYSRSLLLKVVEQSGLHRLGEFQRPKTIKWWQGDLRRHLPGLNAEPVVFVENEDVDKRYAAARLGAGLIVEAIPRTQLLKISVTSLEPELAALAANQIVDTYIDAGLEARLTKTKSANAWLGGRLESMKSDLATAEQKLQDFLAANELVDVGGVRNLVEKDITQNTANLLAARKTVAELTAVVTKIAAAKGDWQKLAQIQAVASNALVQKTRTEYLNAREKLAAVARRYGPKHPKRINVETIHRESETSYVTQVNAAANNIQSNFDLANQRVRDLSKFTNENRTELQQLDRKTYELRVLEREVDASRKLYDLFLSKLKETDLSDDFQTVNAIVIDEAQSPGAPSAPRRNLIVAAAFVGAFLLLYGIALLRWMLDNTVRDPDQLKEKLPHSVLLGGVPNEKALANKAGKGLSKALQKSPKFTEAVQSVRTSLLLCEPDKSNQVIMLTSALPAEGKTTLSVALAASFGRLTKTLVIEADLRRPKFSKLMGSNPSAKGLAQVLVNACDVNEVIQHHEEFGVDYLPAGAMPPNPLELLGSQRFKVLLEQLRTQYERIVIDCPPVEPVSDTLLVASQADAMVYVLRADSTSSVVAGKNLASLEEAGARVVGVILNALDTQRLSKYYGGRYAGYGASGYYRSLGKAVS